uniref:tRNA dihydrouridine synthase n=1 Tax=Anaerovibrio sp. TaxID=1872532 RepID=UPI0025D2CB3C
NIYIAPLEGITGFTFRNIFNRYFGQGVTKYFTPFLAICAKKGITDKAMREVAPANTNEYKLVPQLMTVTSTDFFVARDSLRSLGYEEINLNFGCPSRTVTAKGRGAGALGDLAKLESFLDDVFKDGDDNISIKTRLGIDDPEEFYDIIQLYNQYPVKELTVHPRTLKDIYHGTPHREVFLEALSRAKMPICYNGDINTPEDYFELCRLTEQQEGHRLSGVMIGRGILKDPSLIRQIKSADKGGLPAPVASKQEIYKMLIELQEEYTERFSGQQPVLFRLKEIWSYLGQGLYKDYPKLVKKIMKTRSLKDYEVYMKQILLDDER